MNNREHIECLIVVRVLLSGTFEVTRRFGQSTSVDGQRGSVETVFESLRHLPPRGLLALAHLQVQTNPLVEFLLLGVGRQNGLEYFGRLTIFLSLEGEERLLVAGDCFQVSRSWRKLLALDLTREDAGARLARHGGAMRPGTR